MPVLPPGAKACPLCNAPSLKQTDKTHLTCTECGASFPIGPAPKPTKKGRK
jgi:ribosomal protein L37AE/L43A